MTTIIKYQTVFLFVLLFALTSCSGNKEPQRDENGEILKNGQFYDNQEAETGKVWICTGGSSHAYHSSEDCYGLQSCRASKKQISIDEAIRMRRTPCHYCHEALEEDSGVGQYVYIDYARVLHTKQGCRAVYKDHNMQVVNPVRPDELTEWNLDRVCSQCVAPEQIEELRRIINNN